MIIPEKIKIGKYYYNVKKCRVVDWKNSNVVGLINYGKQEIKLKMFKNNDRLNEDNFFHEISHGILKELEYNHPQISKFRNDEPFVQELGLTLRKTFLDLLDNRSAE